MDEIPNPQGTALFDTALGRCAIAWSDRGVVGTRLPTARAADSRAAPAWPASSVHQPDPPREVRLARAGIIALLDGEPADLSAVALDMAGIAEFDRCVYDVARTVGPGETITYGEIAKRLGEPDAREVGRALGRNRFPIVVPCHRVIAAGGKLGGFSAPGGAETKRRLLETEAQHAGGAPTLFD